MTRLIASNRMIGALALRQLEGKRDTVKARVEGDPACGQARALSTGEQHLFHGRYREAGEMFAQIEAALNERAERKEVEAAGAAQERLLAARGVDTVETQSKTKARDGLLWLIAKKRLTPQRADIGQRYSLLYGRVLSDGLTSSCNDNGRGQGGEDPVEARMMARHNLDAVRWHIRHATGGERLADLLDAVCGRGDSLRQMAGGDGYRAFGLEVELNLALDMAGVSLGVIRA